MVKQSDYEYTLRFREAIKKLIIEQVDKMRPPYRYGTCNSVDPITRKVSVTLVGDTVPVTVKMGSLVPLSGQIVRVEGYVGDRFVADILADNLPIVTWNPVYNYSGVLTVLASDSRIYNDSGRALTISNVRASVGVVPTGSSIVVDIIKNGSTIYTTTGNRPTITAGSHTDIGGAPDDTGIAIGDYFTVSIVQIGSTVAGSDLTVQIVAA